MLCFCLGLLACKKAKDGDPTSETPGDQSELNKNGHHKDCSGSQCTDLECAAGSCKVVKKRVNGDEVKNKAPILYLDPSGDVLTVDSTDDIPSAARASLSLLIESQTSSKALYALGFKREEAHIIATPGDPDLKMIEVKRTPPNTDAPNILAKITYTISSDTPPILDVQEFGFKAKSTLTPPPPPIMAEGASSSEDLPPIGLDEDMNLVDEGCTFTLKEASDNEAQDRIKFECKDSGTSGFLRIFPPEALEAVPAS